MTVGQLVKLDRVVEAVLAAANIPREEVFSSSRVQPVTTVRQVCMWAGRTMRLTYVELGDYFRRNYTTVMYAFDVIEARLAQGDGCPADVRELADVARKELGIAGGVKTETEAEVGATGVVQAA